jgi:hypothetical protein
VKTIRRIGIANLIVSLALVVGACDSPDQESAETVPNRPGGGSDSAATRIDKALLTVADMPAGYLQEQDPSSLEATSEAPTAACRSFISYLGDKEVMADSNPKRFVAFSQGESSRLVHGVVLLSSDAAERYMGKLKEMAGNCSGWTEKDTDGSTIEYRVEALSLPQVAEQTFAFSIRSESGDTLIGLDIAVFRDGKNLAMIGLSHIGAGDQGLLERSVRLAGERLGRVG